jgi:hypothetical protein
MLPIFGLAGAASGEPLAGALAGDGLGSGDGGCCHGGGDGDCCGEGDAPGLPPCCGGLCCALLLLPPQASRQSASMSAARPLGAVARRGPRRQIALAACGKRAGSAQYRARVS